MIRCLKLLWALALVFQAGCSDARFSGDDSPDQQRNSSDNTSDPKITSREIGVNNGGELDIGNDGRDRVDNLGTNPPGTITGSGGKTFLEKCADDAASAPVSVAFPAITNGCPFGSGDNGGDSKSVRPTARNERRFDVPLPADAKELCGISLAANSQYIKFDDAIIVTLNELVIAANGFIQTHFSNHLTDIGDSIYEYKWGDLIYQGYQKNEPYCTPFSTCSIPVSESTGAMQFDLRPEWFEKSGALAKINQDRKFTLGTSVTGNHQDSDCKTTGFTITGTIRYLPK